MDTNHTPEVGDRVRRASWVPSMDAVDVTAIGRYRFLGVDSDGEFPYDIDDNWVKVIKPTPLPEQWLNVYPGNIGWPAYGHGFTAEECAGDHRIAVLHIWTDADGVDHAEIERVER